MSDGEETGKAVNDSLRNGDTVLLLCPVKDLLESLLIDACVDKGSGGSSIVEQGVQRSNTGRILEPVGILRLRVSVLPVIHARRVEVSCLCHSVEESKCVLVNVREPLPAWSSYLRPIRDAGHVGALSFNV